RGEVVTWWDGGAPARHHENAGTNHRRAGSPPQRPKPATSVPGRAPLLLRFRLLLLEKLPLFALSLCSSIVTYYAQSGEAIRSFAEYPLSIRLVNGVMAYCAYVGQTFWPANLGNYYPHPAGEINTLADVAIPLWQPLAAFLLLVAMSTL